MRHRIYVDGRPSWSENDPGRARVSGYGGSLVTHAVTVLPPPRVRIPRAPLNRVRPICGQLLRLIGEPCAGIPGHRGHHRSALALANRAVGRRG